MSFEVYFFISGDDKLDKKAQKILKSLSDVSIKYVRDAILLKGVVDLPFIETNDGSRYYGVESIKDFAKCIDKDLQTA